MTLTEGGVTGWLGSASAKLKAWGANAARSASLSTKKMADMGHSSLDVLRSFSDNVQLVINARNSHWRAISSRRGPGAFASTGT